MRMGGAVIDPFRGPAETIRMYSVVTSNRNRLPDLVQSLRTWQSSSLIAEIVVVDFGSDRPIELDDFAAPDKIKIVRVLNTDQWRPGLAHNIGVDHANQPAICKLDADIAIRDETWLRGIDTAGAFYRGHHTGPVSHGQVVFAKRHWQAVGGYHEWLAGYGFEDSDFYIRLRKSGLPQHAIDPRFLGETTHSLESRTTPKIVTEFFALDPPDPRTRLQFTGSRNTYLAYMCAWQPHMRLAYKSQPLAGGTVAVELPPFPEAYRKAAAFANCLALIRMTGAGEHVDLLNAMMAKFLGEDGGL